VDLAAGSTVWTSADTKNETGGNLLYCVMDVGACLNFDCIYCLMADRIAYR